MGDIMADWQGPTPQEVADAWAAVQPLRRCVQVTYVTEGAEAWYEVQLVEGGATLIFTRHADKAEALMQAVACILPVPHDYELALRFFRWLGKHPQRRYTVGSSVGVGIEIDNHRAVKVPMPRTTTCTVRLIHESGREAVGTWMTNEGAWRRALDEADPVIRPSTAAEMAGWE